MRGRPPPLRGWRPWAVLRVPANSGAGPGRCVSGGGPVSGVWDRWRLDFPPGPSVGRVNEGIDFVRRSLAAGRLASRPAADGAAAVAAELLANAAELTRFITMVSAPAGIADTGAHLRHLTTGTIDRREEGCRPNCPCSREMHLLGDAAPAAPGAHPAAEQARAARRTYDTPRGHQKTGSYVATRFAGAGGSPRESGARAGPARSSARASARPGPDQPARRAPAWSKGSSRCSPSRPRRPRTPG